LSAGLRRPGRLAGRCQHRPRPAGLNMPLPGRRQGRAPTACREELNWTLFPPELSRRCEPPHRLLVTQSRPGTVGRKGRPPPMGRPPQALFRSPLPAPEGGYGYQASDPLTRAWSDSVPWNGFPPQPGSAPAVTDRPGTRPGGHRGVHRLGQRHPAAQHPQLPQPGRIRRRQQDQEGKPTGSSALSVKARQPPDPRRVPRPWRPARLTSSRGIWKDGHLDRPRTAAVP
jgi:hypothetical protein